MTSQEMTWYALIRYKEIPYDFTGFTTDILFPWKVKYRVAWTKIVLTKGLQQTFLRVIFRLAHDE